MDECQRNLITADMTVKQIKQKKKEAEGEFDDSEENGGSETGGKKPRKKVNDSDSTAFSLFDGLMFVAEVNSMDSITNDIRQVVIDTMADFQKANPDKKARIALNLVWD